MDPKVPLSAEELEGKKRKEEKAKEKNLKKQKAALKAEAAKLQVWLKSAREMIKDTKGIIFVVHPRLQRVPRFSIVSAAHIRENILVIEGDEDLEISISNIDYTFAAFSKTSGQFESKSNKKFFDLAYNRTSRLHLNFSLPDSTAPPCPFTVILLGLLVILVLKFVICAVLGRKPRRVSRRKHKRVSRRNPKGISLNNPEDNNLGSNEEIRKERDSEEEQGRAVVCIDKKRDSKEELGSTDDISIGKITMMQELIACGSSGTTVYKGLYEGNRSVAVKRFWRQQYKLADREIHNLVLSDHHTNIVRYHGVEKDKTFIYLALEMCDCSLSDLVNFNSNSLDSISFHTTEVLQKINVKVDLDLWKNNIFPSPQLLKLMRDVVLGVGHLHNYGFIHRDLKPHNILLRIEGDVFCAKVADMGISKRLVGDNQTLSCLTGSGSSGWRAPEQLCGDRLTRVETRAVDLFTLGLVIFYCLTKGKHPFGEGSLQDYNIMSNNKDLFLVNDIPEAVDLLTALLDPKPELRPAAREVCNHPLFWDSTKRLAFLIDVHTALEEERKKTSSNFISAVEAKSVLIYGGISWSLKVKNIIPHCRSTYDSTKVRELIRLIRNVDAHYYGFTQVVRNILCSRPRGIDIYFRSKFPRLLMEMYMVIKTYRASEDRFSIYFS